MSVLEDVVNKLCVNRVCPLAAKKFCTLRTVLARDECDFWGGFGLSNCLGDWGDELIAQVVVLCTHHLGDGLSAFSNAHIDLSANMVHLSMGLVYWS